MISAAIGTARPWFSSSLHALQEFLASRSRGKRSNFRSTRNRRLLSSSMTRDRKVGLHFQDRLAARSASFQNQPRSGQGTWARTDESESLKSPTGTTPTYPLQHLFTCAAMLLGVPLPAAPFFPRLQTFSIGFCPASRSPFE